MEMEAPRFLSRIENAIRQPSSIETAVSAVLRETGAPADLTINGTKVSWTYKRSGKPFSTELVAGLHKGLSDAFDALPPADPKRGTARIASLLQLRERIDQTRRSAPAGETRNGLDVLAQQIGTALRDVSAEERNRANQFRQHAEAFASRTKREGVMRLRQEFGALSEQEARLKEQYERLSDEIVPAAEPESFTRVGTSEQRREDQQRQDAQEAVYRAEREQKPELAFGSLLEAFMQTELARQDWFGARFVRSSKYDDFWNGTDGILEWLGDRPETSVRLALDFTVAEGEDNLKYKLGKVQRGVQIKNFRSTVADARGRAHESSLSNVPMVILGVDRAALRRMLQETDGDAEKLEEHPVRSLLVEQAFVQVGLQVREVAARLVGNVVGREGAVSAELRAAVEAYQAGMKSDRSFTKNVAGIAELFSGIPADEFGRGFQNKDQGSRLYQLLGVFGALRERRDRIRDEHEVAKAWVGPSRTHETLSAGLHALRLAWLGRLGERFGLAAQQPFPELALGDLRRALERLNRRERFFRRSLERFGLFFGFAHSTISVIVYSFCHKLWPGGSSQVTRACIPEGSWNLI